MRRSSPRPGSTTRALPTWEDLVAAAQELTVVEDGKITRAGLNFSGLFGSTDTFKSWIWQMGGNFYDGESGTWTYSSPEGEAALQKMWEIYNGDTPVNSFDIITNDTDDLVQGRLACHLNGAYAISNTEALYPEFDADGISTPPLADAVENVIYPAHMGVVTLSRRLADDERSGTIALASSSRCSTWKTGLRSWMCLRIGARQAGLRRCEHCQLQVRGNLQGNLGRDLLRAPGIQKTTSPTRILPGMSLCAPCETRSPFRTP